VFFSITLRKRPPAIANPIGMERASTSVTESISCIDSASSRRAQRHRLVGVHSLAPRLAEELVRLPLHERHARLPAHQQHFLDLLPLLVLLASTRSTSSKVRIDQVHGERVDALARERDLQIHRLALAVGDVVQLDDHVAQEREVDFRRLGRALDPLHATGDWVRSIFVSLAKSPVRSHDAVCRVDAAQEGVAPPCRHLPSRCRAACRTLTSKCPAQVVDEDLVVESAVEAVGQRRRRRLVHDALDAEAGRLRASFTALRWLSFSRRAPTMMPR